ncbi:MAG: MFS transporter [Bacteroidetes bacterium]|nr:MFS transporter [Bacteroidota bacterium]
MKREVMKAVAFGTVATIVVAFLIVAGSRNLAHFDAALVGYTFAVLFATFGIVYRYAMWLQRPPTALYWRRGWQMFLKRGHRRRNAAMWGVRMVKDVALNGFIRNRDLLRWAAHLLLMWGCILAFAITIPLVFGWLHFGTVTGRPGWYRAFLFGFPSFTFSTESAIGFIIFHGLVWASILVIGGVMLAVRRRVRDHGAAALERFGEDFLPLILLFGVSMTGLMLTVCYTWLDGYGYEFIAILHAITVIFTLLWLPFGKLFHVFQRMAQLGVSFYRDVGQREGLAPCRRCGVGYATSMHVADLIDVERTLGFDYAVADPRIGHYQHICPACRRKMLVLSQGRIWADERRGFDREGANRAGNLDTPN